MPLQPRQAPVSSHHGPHLISFQELLATPLPLYYTVRKDSPFVLHSLLELSGKGSQTQSPFQLVTTKFLLSLTLKARIFLLRFFPRQPAQCGLTNPHVTSQDITLYPETNQKPTTEMFTVLYESKHYLQQLQNFSRS